MPLLVIIIITFYNYGASIKASQYEEVLYNLEEEGDETLLEYEHRLYLILCFK